MGRAFQIPILTVYVLSFILNVLVFKTFLKKEITCNSNVVVIATATSRDSVHPALRTSHGNHVFCKSVEIPLPSLDQRANIIYTILKAKDLSLIDEDLRYIDTCIVEVTDHVHTLNCSLLFLK